MNERARELLLRYAPLAVIAGGLVWHAAQYGFITDDAFISFVFSRNFAEHGQLVFNPGLEPVEGYTNFLWTFLLGLLMVVGLPPEPTSLVLGVGFGVGGLVVAFKLVEHIGGGRSPWDYLAPALLALASGFACWSTGGLETQMFAFWVALALYAYTRAESEPRWFRILGAVLALAALTRPEGLLVAGVLGLHRLALDLVRDRRLPGREELLAIAVFAAIWIPYFAWRWHYYGYPLPNTAYVKAAGEAAPGYQAKLFDLGLYYVWQWATQTKVLFAAPLLAAGLALARPRSQRFVFGTAALLLGVAYLAYAARVGGDFMGLHRFLMPVFFLAAVGVALGLRLLCGILPDKPRPWVTGAAAVALLLAFGKTQVDLTRESLRFGNWKSDRGIDTPAYLWVYAHDRELIGKHMRECFEDGDFSIFGGVGAKPYYAQTRGIDVFGLVSERIAHEVPRTRPRPGHNKWGPDRLLAEYEPDFVFSCYSIHRDPARPRLNCSPHFWLARGFEKITLHVPGLLERGEYYTFLARADREFECPGIVHRSRR